MIMKRIVFILLLFLSVLCNAQNRFKVSVEGKNAFVFEAISPSECMLVGFDGDKDYLDILRIPSEVEYYGKKFTVTRIADSDYGLFPFVREVFIPKTIKRIGKDAFSFFFTTNVSNVHFEEGLLEIGKYAFRGARIAVPLEIPNSVRKIEEGAFQNAYIHKLILGKNIKIIEDESFATNPHLDTIWCYNPNPPILGKNAFNTEKVVVMVPKGSLNAYINANGWNEHFLWDFKDFDPQTSGWYVQKKKRNATQTTSSADGAVDLGLSVKWATCNIGASSSKQVGQIIERCPNSGLDEATIQWGVLWRTPTKEEYKELIENCAFARSPEKDGLIVTGPSGRVIFLPYGSYWTSAETNTGDAYGFGCYSDGISVYKVGETGERYIRAVCKKKSEIKTLQLSSKATQTSTPVASTVTPKNHKYVDLGLSVKWATFNVGANSPEEYGDYFAWGVTEPHYTEGHAQDSICSDWKKGKIGYGWYEYKWCKGSFNTQVKYCSTSDQGTVDGETVLDVSDDAATAKWGAPWRMPTQEEQMELIKKCTWTWTTKNGVNGYNVVGPNGNSIFLPAAGCRFGNSLLSVGVYGYYWTSSLDITYSSRAHDLLFYSTSHIVGRYARNCGLSVRPVCP